LEERGDVRGEYLRLLCAFAALPKRQNKQRKALQARFRELSDAIDPDWQLAVGRTIDIVLNKMAIIRGSWDVPDGSPIKPGGFEALQAVLRAFPTLDKRTRKMLTQELASRGQWLLAYADEAATQSVRTSNAEELRAGFTALALENGQNDYREVLITLSLLVHSAGKLGISADTLLQEAIAIAPSPTRKLIRSFFKRTPNMRQILHMGYLEGTSAEGFVYEQLPEEEWPNHAGETIDHERS
jgi:hypothetical protein